MNTLLNDNTANIEKVRSLTAGLSAAQMNWRPQPGKWSIAQNLAHLNFGYQYFDTIASSIAAARAKGIIGNGPFRYGWLSSWIMKSQEPPPKRKFKAGGGAAAAVPTTPPPMITTSRSSTSMKIAFDNGILEMNCAYALRTDGMFSDNEIRELLINKL